MSYAAWTSSGVLTQGVDGGVGLFYVDVSNMTTFGNGVVVRQSDGGCNADNSYTYKNYVCVYKRTDNIDCAFVSFALDLKDGDGVPSTVVKEFSVTRALADERGTPIGDKTELSVINFASNKPISEFSESQYNFNPYIKLEFESGAGQYYALDVTIVTSAEVSFDFKAVATLYDEHDCNEPNTLFLGFGNWRRSYSSKLTVTKYETTGLDSDGYLLEEMDCQIDVVLTAGTSFKMIKSNSDGTDIAVYYRPERGDLSVHSDYAEVQGGGDIKVTTTGLYRVRFYGNAFYWYSHDNGAIEYRIAEIELTMLRKITDDLTETDEPGFYIVGVFNDDKTCEEYKIEDEYANVEGFLSLDYSAFKSIRLGDSFKVVEQDSNGVITECARSVVAEPINGEKIFLFDTLSLKAYSAYNSYRIVVDLNGVVPNSDVTIGYRRIIDDISTSASQTQSDDLASAENAILGFQFNTGNLNSFVSGGKTLYYADIDYDEQLVGVKSNFGYTINTGTAGDIVSLTVHGNGSSSYDINMFSGAFTQLAGGYSYRITARSIPTPAQNGFAQYDCNNWIGDIAQGRSGNTKAFALDNSGYVVLNASGDKISNLARTRDDDPSNPDKVLPFTAEVEKTAEGAQKFVVFINGNAEALNNSDDLSRITKAPNLPFAFSTVDTEKALGTYFMEAKTGTILITYLSQQVSDVIVTGVAWDDSCKEGYYAVGQFSRWEVYPEYELIRDETVKTDLVFSHDRIITVDDIGTASGIIAADQYKIVHVYNNYGTVAFGWCGKTLSTDSDDNYLYNGGNNIAAQSTTLRFGGKSVFGGEITASDGHFYAVGEFSEWKVYGQFKLAPDASGYFAVSSPFIVGGDSFKIWHNGVSHGVDRTTDNDYGNVTAEGNTVYFDAFRMIQEDKSSWTILEDEYYNIGGTGSCVPDDRIRLFVTFTNDAYANLHLWAWGKTEDGTTVDYAVGVIWNNARDDDKILLKEVAPKVWAVDIEKDRNGIIELEAFLLVNSRYNTASDTIYPTVGWGGCQMVTLW